MNVACGDQISLNEIVDNLNELSKNNIKPIYGPERTGDVRHSKASVEKIEKFLGYKPKFYFKDGLEIVFNWYKEVYEN
jgi:UDP-N-acetylglucosamine 4-epimerase